MALEMYVKSKTSTLGTRAGQTVYYATPKQNDRMELEKVLNHVVNATSLARGDAKNCIESFFEVVCEALSDGKLVDLGEMGSFKVIVPSKYMDTPEDVTVSKALNTPKIQFKAKKAMTAAAKSVSVTIDHSFGEYATTGSSGSTTGTGAGSDTSSEEQGGD
ncbi:MAG: HU family DNA-binding protein [Prevotellaceae bacterium]|nr:HU family DNA-binding protein [Prevotellaceae bacterium]